MDESFHRRGAHPMFKIGDFSRISRVSIKTLHHYDEVGLFKPAEVDPWTGYRFYHADQLPQLNQILVLKDLGFTLDEIKQLVHGDVPNEQLAGVLRHKHAELQRHVQAEQARLQRIEARLHMIEENTMTHYDVQLKQVEPQLVISARAAITSPEHTLVYRDGAMFAEGDLVGLIGEHCDIMAKQVCIFLGQTALREAGPWLLIYNQSEHTLDLEMALIVDGTPSTVGNERVGVRTLPGVAQVASVIHNGSYATLQQAYTALGSWLEANGYTIAGACREIYLRGPHDPITEIQFPVAKR